MQDAQDWVGVEDMKLSKKTLEEIFDNYEKSSFVSFAKGIKNIIYGKNIFDYLIESSEGVWDLQIYLEFLTKEKIIKVQRNGKVMVLQKGILFLIPQPLDKTVIQKRIEKRLRKELLVAKPVTSVFPLKLEADYDQMPISISSALFLVEKILQYIPLKKKFLFVGDDDFVSVFLALADPSVESVVIDIDENLLERIDELAKKYNLKIKTKKVDVRKKQKMSERFVGFLVNPAYNFAGVKKFVEFGVSHLGKDGGFVFVEIGDEAIGNRFLYLQQFFAKRNLLLEELITKKISYPWVSLHEEDKMMQKKLEKFVDRETIEKSPKLAASLWIFDYIPFRVKKVNMKSSIYSYI